MPYRESKDAQADQAAQLIEIAERTGTPVGELLQLMQEAHASQISIRDLITLLKERPDDLHTLRGSVHDQALHQVRTAERHAKLSPQITEMNRLKQIFLRQGITYEQGLESKHLPVIKTTLTANDLLQLRDGNIISIRRSQDTMTIAGKRAVLETAEGEKYVAKFDHQMGDFMIILSTKQSAAFGK